MTFHSPYNFVPLQKPVLLQGVQSALSSGIPLKDGLCGSLALEVEALTPVLVGAARESAAGAPTHVHPFQFPDGRYGLPGSSLHGMLRGVVEAVMGGRMRQVDDRRFALRDFTSSVKADYAQKMVNAKAGFLRRGPDGRRTIVPCEFLAFSHSALEPAGIRPRDFGTSESSLKQGGQPISSIAHKRQLLTKAFPGLGVDFSESAPDKNGKRFAQNLKPGARGVFVVTAQINDGTKEKGKSHDYIFHGCRDAESIAVTPSQWRDFLATHDDDLAGSLRPWPGYWRERHDRGEDVPVFYLHDETGLRFGLARMFRLAGRTSTHDALRAVLPELLAEGVDLSDALFGTLGEGGEGAARGRVSCAPFYCTSPATQPMTLKPTVLGSPKASYYPAYLYQGKDWSTPWQHWDGEGDRTPRLRGRKRYYARAEVVDVPAPPEKSGASVHTILNPLPAQTRFAGRIVVHNLAPFELGALLWAIDLGEHPKASHQLGMGKPFGLGRIRLTLQGEGSRLRPNDPSDDRTTEALLDAAREAFRSFIARQFGSWELWLTGAPVDALLAMADPEGYRSPELDASRYPNLKGDAGNEFTKARGSAGPLPFASAKEKKIPKLRAEQDAKDNKYRMSDTQENEAEVTLRFEKQTKKLFALIDNKEHPFSNELASAVLSSLSDKLKDKAADKKLKAKIRYVQTGNAYAISSCTIVT